MAESNEHIVDNLTKNLEEELEISDNANVNDVPSSENEDVDDDSDFEESEANLKLEEEDTTLSTEEKEEKRKTAIATKDVGNAKFRENLFKEAAKLYTEALHCCPLLFSAERAILYNNRAAAFAKLGLKEKAINDCGKAIEFNPKYTKALARRAKLYEEDDKLDEALADYKNVLEIEPSHREAREAVKTLPRKIEERNEKLKAEMMGKLKDLGNLVLRPFGLSTDNFQINKDPNTGSFSVSMK